MDVTDGVFPVIVTPFEEDDAVDFDALEAHVERLTDAGVHGIIPCGTTGEIATQTESEQRQVIETVVESTDLPVIAGTGSNSTQTTVERTQTAEAVGAEAALVVSPYYNQPNRPGLVAHYETVADAVDIPLLIYNVPHRTGQNVAPDVVAELAEHPNIAGIKDSSGDMNQLSTLCVETRDADFDVMSGYDSLLMPLLGAGGTGVVSIAGNVFPERMVDLYEATLAGETDRARQIHQALLPLQDAFFCDTNPLPVKEALAHKGHMSAAARLPLAPMADEADVARVHDALAEFERATEL